VSDIRPIAFAPKDEALRRDVSFLGALVGGVVREQEGAEAYEAVEAARRAAIARRETAGAGAELADLLWGLDPSRAEVLVRAFALWFRVTNLAEQVHRVRRRRAWEASGRPGRGTLAEAAGILAASGRTDAEIVDLVRRVRLEPVFTAHPTEATRRLVLEKMQRIARVLVERLDRPASSSAAERAAAARIRRELTAVWLTDEHPEDRPAVADEVEHVLYYLADVLYPLVPALYEGMRRELRKELAGQEGEALPILVRFASWVGGDMDGNPNVDAGTIRATLERHREVVLRMHRVNVERLRSRLTHSKNRTRFDEDVLARLDAYRRRFPDTDAAIPGRYRDMPYENLLRFVVRRLDETRAAHAAGYAAPDDLLDDLRCVEESLRKHDGPAAGGGLVRRVRRRVETFGFHLAALDVRQDAEVHRAALAGDAAVLDRCLDVFRALSWAREAMGPEALGPYIVSMSRRPEDVLAVLELARRAGLVDEGEGVPLDVAPLFETVADLERARETLAALFADGAYRAHLRSRGDRQVVMIGYSDSNKDGGIAAARWALHRAQERIVAACDRAGVEPVLFHGRGGTISRGGGSARRAALSAPPGSVRARLRVTEQGEMIDLKFGMRPIALRTLEQEASAVLLATGLPPADDPRAERWAAMMERIAGVSREAYRGLVRDDPGFLSYFRSATPIDVIERMPIGSRPPSRKAGGGPESLRAIPWVFAWTQSRHLLPGWFGVGAGLESGVTEFGEKAVSEMARGWAFLAALLGDVEMVLAKADLAIAERYAALAGEEGRPVFETIGAEYRRTRDVVLRLRGRTALLEDEPALARSIRLRNPYVDPMSVLQVDLLRRWRDGGRADASLFRALQATVRGIAQGLRNTG
jgi:phosphoenolpyruvate carboxylase